MNHLKTAALSMTIAAACLTSADAFTPPMPLHHSSLHQQGPLVDVAAASTTTSSTTTTAPTTSTTPSSSNRLDQNALEDDDGLMPSTLPSWVDLPRQAQVKSELPASAEQWSGRLAMVGAMSFIVGELTTGHSVMEQVADAVARLP